MLLCIRILAGRERMNAPDPFDLPNVPQILKFTLQAPEIL